LTIDCRGAGGYNGGTMTVGYFDNLTGLGTDHKTVMEGHVSGGTYTSPGFYNADGTYNVAALATWPLGNGETLGELAGLYDKVSVYCTSGYGAARVFFVLDALLGTDVQLYDGSMSQWMQYAAAITDADLDTYDDNTAAGLPIASAWSVIPYTDHGVLAGPAYNATDNGVALDKIERVNYLIEEAADFPTPASVPNQVETADEEYMSTGGASTTPVGAFTDNGGVGC
jgi:hypothetical protein